MDNINELLYKAFSEVQSKNDKDKTDNSVKFKIARVEGYDSSTYKAIVTFLDDTEENNLYTIYNKTNENLSVGDSVKVFYTSNPAKGWIGTRGGEPDRDASSGAGLEPITAITINSDVDYTVSTNAGQERYVGIFEAT